VYHLIVTISQFLANQTVFESLLPDLYDGAPGKFALIHNGGLVGFYDSGSDAVDEGYRRFGTRAGIYVRKITTEPEMIAEPGWDYEWTSTAAA
jgi:hypothetical protein